VTSPAAIPSSTIDAYSFSATLIKEANILSFWRDAFLSIFGDIFGLGDSARKNMEKIFVWSGYMMWRALIAFVILFMGVKALDQMESALEGLLGKANAKIGTGFEGSASSYSKYGVAAAKAAAQGSAAVVIGAAGGAIAIARGGINLAKAGANSMKNYQQNKAINQNLSNMKKAEQQKMQAEYKDTMKNTAGNKDLQKQAKNLYKQQQRKLEEKYQNLQKKALQYADTKRNDINAINNKDDLQLKAEYKNTKADLNRMLKSGEIDKTEYQQAIQNIKNVRTSRQQEIQESRRKINENITTYTDEFIRKEIIKNNNWNL
jgi:hypothetical protein